MDAACLWGTSACGDLVPINLKAIQLANELTANPAAPDVWNKCDVYCRWCRILCWCCKIFCFCRCIWYLYSKNPATMADKMAHNAINTKITLKPCTGRHIPYTTSSRILPWNTVTASCLLSGVNAKSASEITSYRPLTPTLALLALLSDTTNDRLLLLWKEDDGFSLLVLLGDTPKLGSESSFNFRGPWGKRSCGSLCKLNVWCCDKTYKAMEFSNKIVKYNRTRINLKTVLAV